MKIQFTEHYIHQWWKRVNKNMSNKRIKYITRVRCYHRFKRGVSSNKNGDFEVKLFPNIYAVLTPGSNGFVAVTVVNKKESMRANDYFKKKNGRVKKKYKDMMEHHPSLRPYEFKGE